MAGRLQGTGSVLREEGYLVQVELSVRELHTLRIMVLSDRGNTDSLYLKLHDAWVDAMEENPDWPKERDV